MKKVFMAAFLLVASNSIFAQVNKGQWLVGGGIAFESSKVGDIDGSKVTTFAAAPNVGYFFVDKLAGGVRASIVSTKNEGDEGATGQTLVGPFLRYYILDAAQKVNIFADGMYGFGSQKFEGESASINQFAITAGPAIFLTPNTALEIGLQYRSTGGEAFEFGDEKERQNGFGVTVGFQIHLGGK
jgi:hypothetical protein